MIEPTIGLSNALYCIWHWMLPDTLEGGKNKDELVIGYKDFQSKCNPGWQWPKVITNC